MLTEVQQESLDVYIEMGSQREAAKKLGISRSALRHRLRAIERKGEAP